MTTFPKRSWLLLLALLFVEGCKSLASSKVNNARRGQILASKKKKKKKVPSIKKPTQWTSDIAIGYRRRVAADPSFPLKSVTEICVAASTQFAAEWSRRGGGDQLLPQFDFVLAGMLTAVYGKYAAMWKVAKTSLTTMAAAAAAADEKEKSQQKNDTTTSALQTAERNIPTNAFQPFLLDGVTRPTMQQRFQSLLLPVGPLFRAGFLASLVGYGLTGIMIALRSWLVPSYIPVTKTVNILYASLYTGVYMATSSNVRYQILQGVIEPAIDEAASRFLRTKLPAFLHATAILLVRTGNGLAGSMLAISGMRVLGLFQLR